MVSASCLSTVGAGKKSHVHIAALGDELADVLAPPFPTVLFPIRLSLSTLGLISMTLKAFFPTADISYVQSTPEIGILPQAKALTT